MYNSIANWILKWHSNSTQKMLEEKLKNNICVSMYVGGIYVCIYG